MLVILQNNKVDSFNTVALKDLKRKEKKHMPQTDILRKYKPVCLPI